MAEDKFLRGITTNIPLTGTDDEIKTQLSLLLGAAQLIEIQNKGLDIDFYKFVELFEDGFSTGFLPKQNVGLNPKYWGQTQKTRPKVRILLESSKTWQSQGYALIELQPDRTTESESYLLFGTPNQLIQQIMYWMNMHRKLANLNVNASGGSVSEKRLPIYVAGKIYIKLHFKGYIRNTRSDHRTERSFRLMNDDPKSISHSRIEALGNRVHSKFHGFTYTTGHDAYNYNEPERGFSNNWGYFLDTLNAKKVFEQMLDIPGYSPNWDRLTRSTVPEPKDRFQEPPDKIQQAGILVRADRERPIADMKFSKSMIKFPRIRKELELTNEFGFNKLLIKEIQKYSQENN